MPNEFTYLAPDGLNDERRGWGKCKSCGQAIYWCRTAKNNRAIPLDRVPVVLQVTTYGTEKVDSAIVHWETCEKRDQARRVAPAADRSRREASADGNDDKVF